MPELTEDPQVTAAVSQRGRWAYLGVLVVVALALACTFFLRHHLSWEQVRINLDVLQAGVRADFASSLLLYVVAFVVITTLPIPIAGLLAMIGGVLFGRWFGTGAAVLASTISATLAFLATRHLLREAIHDRFRAGMDLVDRAVDRDGAFYLFTLRLVPGFPFCVVNMVLALTRMRLQTFVWVSVLGMLPATFLFVNAGHELGRIESVNDVLSPNVVGALALLGLAPLAMRKLLQVIAWWRRPSRGASC